MGKQSLARLATFVNGYSTFQVVITACYNVNDLKADLQITYREAGLKSEGISFLCARDTRIGTHARARPKKSPPCRAPSLSLSRSRPGARAPIPLAPQSPTSRSPTSASSSS